MSNINQNNFNNCMNLQLSNSGYWDLFICNDCGCSLDHQEILDKCVIIDIDVDNNKCISGDSLCSLVGWTGDTCFEKLSLPTSALTLNDIGLTGIDNGFISYDCNLPTTGSTFINTYTGSSLTITSADTKFCFTKVSGCTYTYPTQFITSANTVGRYVELCGGFYQGFFKLSDRTFYKDISNNMFVWPMEWFNCPPQCGSGCTGTTSCDCNNNNVNPIFIPGSTNGCNDGTCGNNNCQLCGTIYAEEGVGGCGPWCKNGDSCKGCPDPRKSYQCYLEKKPTPWDYQILPTRYESGWTAEFWMRRNSKSCTGDTGTTINALYPNNEGLFYYMGTRSENKFWDVFSGETGYTTTSGYPLPPPKITKEELLNNSFLVYQPQGDCYFTGVTKVTIDERDKNADIVDNTLGFRIKEDGSIGYRSLGVSGVCSAVTSTTITTSCDNCGSSCNCNNCQLCGTIYGEEGVGGCGSWCKDCDSPTCKVTGTTVQEKYVTGVTVNEEYSEGGIIPNDEWFQLAIRFCAYEEYLFDEMDNIPRRKGRLDFFVNGYLKYSIEDFDEFLFKDLYEYREKQEGVPFNYSLGGGTQGLLETNTIGGPDPLDENLIIQENFAGSFFGDISKFRLYECCLDITTIRYRFKKYCLNYGICPQELIDYLLTENSNIISSEDGEDFLIV